MSSKYSAQISLLLLEPVCLWRETLSTDTMITIITSIKQSKISLHQVVPDTPGTMMANWINWKFSTNLKVAQKQRLEPDLGSWKCLYFWWLKPAGFYRPNLVVHLGLLHHRTAFDHHGLAAGLAAFRDHWEASCLQAPDRFQATFSAGAVWKPPRGESAKMEGLGKNGRWVGSAYLLYRFVHHVAFFCFILKFLF